MTNFPSITLFGSDELSELKCTQMIHKKVMATVFVWYGGEEKTE